MRPHKLPRQEHEVGVLIGGERATLALDDINTELRHFLTDSEQRPRTDRPLHRAIAEVEHWQAAEIENRGKLAALDRQFQELTQYRRRLGDLTDPAAARQATAELLAAKKALAEAQSAARELRRFEAEEMGARRSLEADAQRLKQLRYLTARIDTNRAAEGALARKLPKYEAREQEARSALARTQLATAGVKLPARERQLERLAGAVLRSQRKEELGRQLKVLDAAVEEWRETDAQLAQIKVKPKSGERLDELDRQIASMDAGPMRHYINKVNVRGESRRLRALRLRVRVSWARRWITCGLLKSLLLSLLSQVSPCR